MKNFLSVLYIKTNPLSEERICIGLFMGGEEKLFFNFSETKFKHVASLVSKEVANSLKSDLKNLKKEVEESSKRSSLYLSSERGMFKEGYFNYLSRYNNGLIHFSKPEPIPSVTTPELFDELYRKFTGEVSNIKEKRPVHTFNSMLKMYLSHDAFETRSNRNFTIGPSIIPSLINTPKVDFISCNGSILAGKAIDLNSSLESIKNHVNEFWVLAEGLREFAVNHFPNSGKYELYINEPTDNENKKIMAALHRNHPKKPFEVKELEKLEKTAGKLENDNYRPFSEVLKQRNINF